MEALIKWHHEASVASHFISRDPGTTPTQAYRLKQKDPKRRSRMHARGKKVGSFKTQQALKSLEELKQHSGHDLAYLRVKKDSNKEPRSLSHNLVLVCACCRRKGSPKSFSDKPCSTTTQAVPKVFYAWLQKCCKEHSENTQTIREALKLSDAEASGTFFKQHPFFRSAACFAANLSLKPFEGLRVDDKSKAQKQPFGHYTCLRCWRTTPQGSSKL